MTASGTDHEERDRPSGLPGVGGPAAGTGAEIPSPVRGAPASPGSAAAAAILLFLLAVVPLSRTAGHPFVAYDDPLYVSMNPAVGTGLTPGGISWAFTTTRGAHWHPLTWISHMADVSLFGLDAGRHHLVSVLLHGGCVLLLFFALRRMTGSFWRSGFAAALFAVHPLHVESVAWLSERKDVLCGFFWMATLWAYAGYARRPSIGRYLPVFILSALALLSKPMAVTLPFVLLLLDRWPLERIGSVDPPADLPGSRPTRPWRALVLEKIPLFLLSAASSAATLYAQRAEHAIVSAVNAPAWFRALNAVLSYGKYMAKSVWPSSLAVFYPHPGTGGILRLRYVALAALVLLAVSWLAVRERRRRPYLLTGWAWFLGTLVPVIGVFQTGAQAMADRYMYIPLAGLGIMAAWGIPDLPRPIRPGRAVLAAAGGAALLALGILSWIQAGYWRSSEILFRHALAVTENNWLAHVNLGTLMARNGQREEATAHFEEAVRIHPGSDEAHYNLGLARFREGRKEEALDHFLAALSRNPRNAGAHNMLGWIKGEAGLAEEAAAHFREALRCDPGLPDAHNNLGVALVTLGRSDEAEAHLREAIRIDPGHAEARYNLALLLDREGRVDDAAAQCRETLRIQPGHEDARRLLGIILDRGAGADAAAAARKGGAAPNRSRPQRP